MQLTNGVSHVASVTEDLDRLIRFYQRVFDADLFGDVMEDDGVRHALIRLSERVMLHPFEIRWVEFDSGACDMFRRGRLDHFGVTVPSVEALLEIRARLLAEGGDVTDGRIRDFGPLYSLSYTDPDGLNLEINLFKPDAEDHEVLTRHSWQVVELIAAA
jgi:catechol 2,3-dioxygenase-like lactoylglutathione lyase family enzyme